MRITAESMRRLSGQRKSVSVQLEAPSGVSRGHAVELLPLIRGLLPTFQRVQRRIAEAVLNDPERFISRSISQLAEDCGVSPGSIVLFCQSLKLAGFPALKIALARELAAPVLPFFSKEFESRDGASAILKRVLEQHVESLHETFKLNTASALGEAVEVMLKAKRIVFFSIGLSYPVAYPVYARLRFLGLPAFIEYDSHLQLAAASGMNGREAAVGISVSGSTSETVECLRLSKARGAKTICITNSINSPLAQAADVRLYAAPSEVKYFQAPLASRLTQLALADVLLVLVGLRRKRKALVHLRRAEEELLKRRLNGSRPRIQPAKKRRIHSATSTASA